MKLTMTDKHAIWLAENCSIRDASAAWQYLENTGCIATLPPWFGRMSASLIEAGLIQHRALAA